QSRHRTRVHRNDNRRSEHRFLEARAEHGLVRRRTDHGSERSRTGNQTRRCRCEEGTTCADRRRNAAPLAQPVVRALDKEMNMSSLLLILAMLAGLQNPPAAANTPRGDAQNGKALFMKFGCYECHGREGQGSAAT